MANARNLSTLAQGASTAGILAGTYGGTGASLSPTTAGNTIFTTNGTTWSSTAKIVQGTSVATTSGTSIDFTGIPSWVKRITVMFNGVSTNGISLVQVQIGSGSITTSGYSSNSSITYSTNQATGSNSTTGFMLSGTNAGNVQWGVFTIYTFSGNTYVYNYAGGFNTNGTLPGGVVAGGSVTISGAIDRLRITTVNGTDTFDAGSVNILYE